MKRTILMLAVAAATMAGCSYGGVAASGNTAVVARNNGFFFGLLNKVYVCQITPTGLTQCSEGESP
jgi:hypothetical protein